MKVESLSLWRTEIEDGDEAIVEWDLQITGDKEARNLGGLSMDDFGLWDAIHKLFGWEAGTPRHMAYGAEASR